MASTTLGTSTNTFSRYPISLYDAGDDVHRCLVELARRAEEVAAGVSRPVGVSFQALRRRVPTELAAAGLVADLDTAWDALLASRTSTLTGDTRMARLTVTAARE